MPDIPGGDTPPTVATLVRNARASFVYQCAPYVDANEEALAAAFNNAIVEIVSILEESVAALADTAADNDRARKSLDEFVAFARDVPRRCSKPLRCDGRVRACSRDFGHDDECARLLLPSDLPTA